MGTDTKSPRDYEKQHLGYARKSFKDHVIVSGSAAERRWVIKGVDKDGKCTSSYWTEIVALENGHLLAHGDIDACMFGRGGYKDPVAIVNWIGRNEYISGYVLEKANIGFNCSHASIGLTTEFEHGVARWQVLNMLRDRRVEILSDLFEEREIDVKSLAFNAIIDDVTEDLCQQAEEIFIRTQQPDEEEMLLDPDVDELNKVFKYRTEHDKEAGVYQGVIEYLDDNQTDTADSRAFYDFFYDELSAITSDVGEIISGIGSVPSIRLIYAFAAIEKLSHLLGESTDVG